MSNWLNQINFPLPKEALHRPTEIFIFFNEIYLSQGAAAEKMSMEILAHSHLTLACNPFKRLIQFTTPSICSQHPEKKQHCSTHIFDFSPPRAVEEVFPTFFSIFATSNSLFSHSWQKVVCIQSIWVWEMKMRLNLLTVTLSLGEDGAEHTQSFFFAESRSSVERGASPQSSSSFHIIPPTHNTESSTTKFHFFWSAQWKWMGVREAKNCFCCFAVIRPHAPPTPHISGACLGHTNFFPSTQCVDIDCISSIE